MDQAEFIVLFEALVGHDLAASQAAEQRFLTMNTENPVGMMLTCANIVQDNKIGDNQRHLAGVLLKNTIRGLCVFYNLVVVCILF